MGKKSEHKTGKNLFKSFGLVMMFFVMCINVNAATRTWTGATSTDWNTASNWQGNNLPGSGDNANIPGGLSRYPSINNSVFITSININSAGTGALVTITTSGFLTATGTVTVSQNGTFIMDDGIASIKKLIISGSVNVSGGTMTTTTGDITVNSGGAISISSSGTMATTSGNIVISNGGSLTCTGGTLNNSTNTLEIDGTLTISGSPSITTGKFTGTAVAGNYTISGGTINISSDFSPSAFSASGGTVNFTGAGGNGTFPWGSDYQFFNVLVTVHPVFDKNGGNTIRVAGDWTCNSAPDLTQNPTTVMFNGTGDQNITGSSSTKFRDLTINKSSGNVILGINTTIMLIISAGGSVNPTNGYVEGNLRRYIPYATGSASFDIGDASGYTPVTISFDGTTDGTGSIDASTSVMVIPPLPESKISQTKYVNRNWTLTNNGVGGFTSYSATFAFLPVDLIGSPNTSAFIIKRYHNSAWSTPNLGTLTSGSSQCTGLTSFGSFYIGEPCDDAPVITGQPVSQTITYGSDASFTVTATGDYTLTYQWQENTGSGFNDISDGGLYSNSTTNSLYLTKPPVSMSGYKYRCVVTNTCGSVNSNSNRTLTVSAKTITGSFTVDPTKIYDGGTVANVLTRSLTGVIFPDDVSLTGGTANYDTKNVGTGKTVTLTGMSLTGADEGNYSLTTPVTTTADITQLDITGSFTVDASKIYDGNKLANVINRTLTGVISPDNVSLTGGTARYGNKNVGTGKTVTLTGMSLTGTDAGNYNLISVSTTTADITKLDITGSFTVDASKIYDGNKQANVTNRSLTGVIPPDVVNLSGVARYDNKNVGIGKTVTLTGAGLTGGDAGNYNLTGVGTTTADITALDITGSFTVDASKVYDGNKQANVTNRSLTGVIPPDVVNLSGVARYDNKNVGIGKTVTLTGAGLTGGDAGDYNLTGVGTTTADITARPINITAQHDSKTYDGNNTSVVSPAGDLLQGTDTYTTQGTQTFDDKNVGSTKIMTATGAVINDGNGGANYNITYIQDFTGVISGKSIDPVITANNKCYDGNDLATLVSQTVTGVIYPDVVTLLVTASNFDNANPGTGKTVTASGLSLGGTDNGNYSLSSATATALATIYPLPVPSISGSSPAFPGLAGYVYTTESGMSNYIWTVSPAGSITSGGTLSSPSVTLTWNTPGNWTVNVNYTDGNGCTAASATVFNILVAGTVWNGTTWSNGFPTLLKDVFINGNYTIGSNDNGVNMQTLGLLINNNMTLNVMPGKTLTVNGDLTNNGTLWLKSNPTNSPSGQLVNYGKILGTGTYKAERNLATAAEHYISSPIPGNTPASLGYNFKYLNPTLTTPIPTSSWAIQASTSALTLMKGYSISTTSTNKLLTFTGTGASSFYSGTESYTTANGTNCVGNPYPCAIDWKATTGWIKTNIGPTIQFRSGTIFATYNASTGATTNGGSRYIPSMQGYLVTSAGTGTLASTNDVRLTNSQVFWKEDEIIPDMLKLKVVVSHKSEVVGQQPEGYETLVLFRDDATSGFDFEYDVPKQFEEEEGITHLFTADADMIPMAQNVLKEAKVIPVGFQCTNDGRYNISATENTLPVGTEAWLEDRKSGAFTNLNIMGYQFDYIKSDEVYRFLLHFKNIDSQQSAVVSISSDGKDILINGNISGNGDVKIYDMLGREIREIKNVPLQFSRLNIGIVPGCYMVRVNTETKSFTGKVIIGR
ncbi:MAG: YDG domain-containing protein [Bacteroidia bacterium]|nr:YDG domain-containing protein [Bacteroidia bacterium]